MGIIFRLSVHDPWYKHMQIRFYRHYSHCFHFKWSNLQVVVMIEWCWCSCKCCINFKLLVKKKTPNTSHKLLDSLSGWRFPFRSSRFRFWHSKFKVIEKLLKPIKYFNFWPGFSFLKNPKFPSKFLKIIFMWDLQREWHQVYVCV